MAFIYLSSGQVLRVPTSGDAIVNDLNRAQPGRMLVYEVDVPSGGATRAAQVTVAASHIAAVSDEPLG